MHRVVLLSLFLIAAVGTSPVNAQNEAKAVLVDEFGLIQCGDLQARTDAFFLELNANPPDTGYVVLFNDERRVTSYANIIRANIYMRRFDPERIKILVGDRSTETAGQFWRTHSRVNIPSLKDVTVPQYDLSGPFIFGGEDENGVCPTFIPELYTTLLKDNPDARGKIEVFGKDKAFRRSFVDMWLEQFENEFGLSRNRIDVVSRGKSGITYANFWVVPAKNK